MRQAILAYLLEHKGEFVSGQKISEMFGISRTAVWKHIRVLKERGYVIDSFTKKGYCLKEAPDLLDPSAVTDHLPTKVLGKALIYYEKTESTNILANKMAAEGAAEGTVVVAEEQSRGRGRLDRLFLSPFAKGLWFSVIFRPPFLPMEVSKMTLLSAVAITRSLRRHGLDCLIKWPNDILVHGKKMVGIRTELNASVEKINYLIMGIGINTGVTKKMLPRDLKKTVTSFIMEGVQVNRTELLRDVLCELEHYYFLAQKQGFTPVLDEWKQLSCTLDADVDVIMPDRSFSGRAVNLDSDGNLLVQTTNGIERVLAGDVHIRSAENKKTDAGEKE